MILKKIFRLYLYGFRKVLYHILSFTHTKKINADYNQEIDVIILSVEKDLAVLPVTLEGVRNNVCHRIKDIYLVSPDSQPIKTFAEKNHLKFVNEESVFGYKPAAINFTIYTGLDRSGWILQQLIKLSGRIGSCRYFLTIDADHVLLKPHAFFSTDGKMIFYQSEEFNLPYYKNIKKLLGFFPVSRLSYVSHKMIFDKEKLKALHRLLEKRAGDKFSWDKVITNSLDANEISGFSEFELYGNYLPAEVKQRVPWKDKAIPTNEIRGLDSLRKLYPTYSTVTFSSYLVKKQH